MSTGSQLHETSAEADCLLSIGPCLGWFYDRVCGLSALFLSHQGLMSTHSSPVCQAQGRVLKALREMATTS